MRGYGPWKARKGLQGGSITRTRIRGQGWSERRETGADQVKRPGGFGQNTRHPVMEALRGKRKDKFM